VRSSGGRSSGEAGVQCTADECGSGAAITVQGTIEDAPQPRHTATNAVAIAIGTNRRAGRWQARLLRVRRTA